MPVISMFYEIIIRLYFDDKDKISSGLDGDSSGKMDKIFNSDTIIYDINNQ